MRSFTSPLFPPAANAGSQYAESSFDSFANAWSSRFSRASRIQMKRAGWRFAGEGALLEIDRRRLLRDAGERDAPALTHHADRLADRVLRPGRVDRDVGAHPRGERADLLHRVAVVIVDGLEAELPGALEAFASAD